MSKITLKPIEIPQGATVTHEGRMVKVLGPKGELSSHLVKGVEVLISGGKLSLVRKTDSKSARSLQGTTYRLLENAIKGVTEGWTKTLEMVGTGYRASLEGTTLLLAIGFSHPVKVVAPEGISFSIEENKITVSGVDKELVGQIAANIRAVREPEPYKGKGIKYIDEILRRKPGKAAAKAGPVGPGVQQ
ncbi:MAG: 50S ribosomal protein L6 [Candidatus Blackburnbacteria bacterium]|nr:50S ribosomal protein L6 [Candidatus Blackburnbacteria bacterium]